MTREVAWLSVVALSGHLLAGPPPSGPPDGEQSQRPSNVSPGPVAALALSERLVEYGRSSRSAAALAVAAQIRLDHPIEHVTLAKEPGTPEGQWKQDASGASFRLVDAQTLLQEARSVAPANGPIMAFIERLERQSGERSRGGVGGSKQHCDWIGPGARDSYILPFKGNELAEVWVQGEVGIDLDCSAFGEKQNLVDYADDCLLRWVPHQTARFRLEIDNLAGVASGYCLTTN